MWYDHDWFRYIFFLKVIAHTSLKLATDDSFRDKETIKI